MIQLFLYAIYRLIHWIQPVVVPLCFVVAWSIIFMAVWSLWVTTRESVARAKQMHQVPCANCKYFTRDYHLKCPIHPSHALSEMAINCPDYDTTHPAGYF